MPAEPTGPAEPAVPRAEPAVAGAPARAGSVGRAVAGYTALRVALVAVLSVVAWLIGLAWIPAVAAGVVLATVFSLMFLRRSTRRLSGVLAAASARHRAARPRLAPEAEGDPTGDLYDTDPYADDEAIDPDDLAHQQQALPQRGRPGQDPDARISARPTSSP